MGALRTSEDLDTLKSDLRALRDDLREVARDVGDLTSQTARHWRQTSARDWLDWARERIGSREDLDDTWSAWRERGERSAAAMRTTVQEHPAATVAGALALGLILAWFLTRPSHR
jgi:ElaB/YqjD/DUF883 family membrane-anchored ribosome-binding protein